jgi:hypothetical protein
VEDPHPFYTPPLSQCLSYIDWPTHLRRHYDEHSHVFDDHLPARPMDVDYTLEHDVCMVRAVYKHAWTVRRVL